MKLRRDNYRLFSCFLIFIILLGQNNFWIANANTTSPDESVMIVIDASGSMSTNNRMDRTKQAAIDYLNNVKGKNIEVGLVKFFACGPTGVEILSEPTFDVESLKTKIAEIKPSGGTPLVNAITITSDYLKKEE